MDEKQKQQEKNIADCLRRLRAACDAFDVCNYTDEDVIVDQALLIAGQLRVLFVDKGTPLFQRAATPVDSFIDTRLEVPEAGQGAQVVQATGFAGMIALQLMQQCFIACLNGTTRKRVPFETWWNSPILKLPPEADVDERTVNRRSVVKKMANEDGYAHYCEKATQYWVDLKGKGTGILVGSFPGPDPPTIIRTDQLRHPRWIAQATVRQIGHEVLCSMLPDYSKLPGSLPGPAFGGGSITFEVE